MNQRRVYVEIDKETLNQLKLYCFLKDIKMKQYLIKTIQKELEPYQQWLQNIKENKN